MFKNQKGSTTTTVVIIVIAIVVVLLVLGLVGCGVYYWWKNAQDNTTPVQTSTTQTAAQTQTSASTSATTSQTQTSESPADVVLKYIKYTLGGIPGGSLDKNAAKNLVSYELAQQLSDSSFVPLSYCIQNGPDDVKVNLDNNSGTVAYVTASANYGGSWDKMWEFETVNGSGGWKIKYIKCIGTGQITQ